MSESTRKINLGFRVTEGRQEELKIAAAKRRESVQRMLELGLELLLSGQHSVNKAESHGNDVTAFGRAAWARWHRMLSYILGSGDREAISAVQQNLSVFYRLVGGDQNKIDEKPLKKVH